METFADLHCHPHMRSFNYFRGTLREKNPTEFHPWHIVISRLRSKQKGKRASAYSQSDLVKLVNGNVRLAFVSLYPIEKGWVTGREGLSRRSVVNLFNTLTKNWLLKAGVAIQSTQLARILHKIGDDKKEKRSLRDYLQMLFMKIPLDRIEFLQSDKYNYFEELNIERNFLLTKNNIETSAEIFFPFLKNKIFINEDKYLDRNREEFRATGTYEIAQNGDEAKRIMDQGKIAFVVTIEGTNVFNTFEDISEIRRRISEMKAWARTPVFFISFSHHFSNNLCGHAKSIPDLGNLLLDQSEYLNCDMDDKGLEIIQHLLSIDGNLDPANHLGRRILVDVKHMSACARQTYYRKIIQPCRDKNVRIPIIASHTAYSGIKTLDELVQQVRHESDRKARSTSKKPFNTWSINISDEDILEIFKSKGLIGISFDERILAIPRRIRKKGSDIDYFWANFSAMLDVILDYPGNDIPEKRDVIHLFCIGTDFDGYINPLDSYPTALEFSEFRVDLITRISRDPQRSKYLFSLTVTEFVDRFCFQNALDFVVRNFK